MKDTLQQTGQENPVTLQRSYLASQLRRAGADPAASEDTLDAVAALYGNGLGKQGVVLPTGKNEVSRLTGMVYRSRVHGEQVRIVSPVCPDYSYKTGIDGKPLYDFNTVNGGVGVTARVVFEKAPHIVAALLEAGVQKDAIHYSILVADIEADDEDIVCAAGMDRTIFLDRVEGSRKATEEEAQVVLGDTKVSVGTFRGFLSAKDYDRAEAVLGTIKEGTIHSIAFSRAGLYSRWFSRLSIPPHEFSDFAVRRATEDVRKYMVFGSAARREGVMVVDATAPEIVALYNRGDGLPPAHVIRLETSY